MKRILYLHVRADLPGQAYPPRLFRSVVFRRVSRVLYRIRLRLGCFRRFLYRLRRSLLALRNLRFPGLLDGGFGFSSRSLGFGLLGRRSLGFGLLGRRSLGFGLLGRRSLGFGLFGRR